MHLYRPIFFLFFCLFLAVSTEARDAEQHDGASVGTFGEESGEAFLKRKQGDDKKTIPGEANEEEEAGDDRGQLNENEHPLYQGYEKHEDKEHEPQPKQGAPFRHITPLSNPYGGSLEDALQGLDLTKAAKMVEALLMELEKHPLFREALRKNNLLTEKRMRRGYRPRKEGKEKRHDFKRRVRARDMQNVDPKTKENFEKVLGELQSNFKFVLEGMRDHQKEKSGRTRRKEGEENGGDSADVIDSSSKAKEN